MDTSGKAVLLNAVLGKIASVIGYTIGTIALIIIVLAIPHLDIEGAVTSMIIRIMVLPICFFLIYKGIQINKRISRFNKLQRFLVSYLAFYLVAMILGGIFMLLYYLYAPAQMVLISILAIPFAGVLYAVFFSRRSRAARIVEGRLKRGEIEPQYFGRHCLELTEYVMEMRYGSVCARREYAGIRKTVEYQGGIIIYNSRSDMDVIPFSAFGNAAHRSAFINYLQSKIAQAKISGVTERSASERERETNYNVEYRKSS